MVSKTGDPRSVPWRDDERVGRARRPDLGLHVHAAPRLLEAGGAHLGVQPAQADGEGEGTTKQCTHTSGHCSVPTAVIQIVLEG